VPVIFEAGGNILLPEIFLGSVEFSNGFILTGVRHIPTFGTNFIIFMDLRPHKPIFD
jgi:hypothetical protein